MNEGPRPSLCPYGSINRDRIACAGFVPGCGHAVLKRAAGAVDVPDSRTPPRAGCKGKQDR